MTVTAAGRTVADHPRCWAKHQTITDPVHRTAADILRGEHRDAAAAGSGRDAADGLQVEQRCLADYDDTFDLADLNSGLDDVDGAVA